MIVHLQDALTKRGRVWGAQNAAWRVAKFAYLHGCPAWKRWGAAPCGAESAKPKAQYAPSTIFWWS